MGSRVVVPPHIRQGLLLQLQQVVSPSGGVAIMAQLQLEGGQALLAAKPAAPGCVDVAHSIALSRPAGDIDGSVLSWRMMKCLQYLLQEVNPRSSPHLGSSAEKTSPIPIIDVYITFFPPTSLSSFLSSEP